MNSVITTIFSVLLLVKHENSNMWLAYRLSHQVPTGMPGIWPNVLLRHRFCQLNPPQFTGCTNRTGHVFAFQTAYLDPYRDPRLSSSRPDGITVSATQPGSQETSSPHSSSCAGGR